MFYDQFIKICNMNHIKPSPVLKELGLSSGNLKRWENGASVNYETLAKLSDYFGVPVDYFFESKNDENSAINIIEEKNSKSINAFTVAFNAIKAHPDFIISMISESKISKGDLIKIANILKCRYEYLVQNITTIVDESSEGISNQSPEFLVLEVLMLLPGSVEYKILQVRISSVIIDNLKKLNINKDKMIEIGLVSKKIDSLYNPLAKEKDKTPLNCFDIINIIKKCNISFMEMLTGSIDNEGDKSV